MNHLDAHRLRRPEEMRQFARSMVRPPPGLEAEDITNVNNIGAHPQQNEIINFAPGSAKLKQIRQKEKQIRKKEKQIRKKIESQQEPRVQDHMYNRTKEEEFSYFASLFIIQLDQAINGLDFSEVVWEDEKLPTLGPIQDVRSSATTNEGEGDNRRASQENRALWHGQIQRPSTFSRQHTADPSARAPPGVAWSPVRQQQEQGQWQASEWQEPSPWLSTSSWQQQPSGPQWQDQELQVWQSWQIMNSHNYQSTCSTEQYPRRTTEYNHEAWAAAINWMGTPHENSTWWSGTMHSQGPSS